MPDNNIENLYLIEIMYDDNNNNSLALISKTDQQLVPFERLQEIHTLIGKTLEKRKVYDSFRSFIDDVTNIRNKPDRNSNNRNIALF